MAVVPDIHAISGDEVAVLGVSKATGSVLVQVKDASSGALVGDIGNIYFLSPAWNPQS